TSPEIQLPRVVESLGADGEGRLRGIVGAVRSETPPGRVDPTPAPGERDARLGEVAETHLAAPLELEAGMRANVRGEQLLASPHEARRGLPAIGNLMIPALRHLALIEHLVQ